MNKCISAKLPTSSDEEFDTALEILNSIQEAKGFESIWSIFETAKVMHEVAIKGTYDLEYDIHWGEKKCSTVVKDPTWLDLWAAADRLIKKSGDKHHVFIEQFIKKNRKLELITGS